MDYVYICREGENEELRYSIRSVVKNANPDNIFVVGYKPDWYVGDFIKVENSSTNKFENITKCYEIIRNIPKLSDDFVLMNDDFFIIKPIESVPVYNDGLLEAKIKEHVALNGANRYALALKEVKKQLLKRGIKLMLNYDIHTPMVFNKTKLQQFNQLSLAPRSLYGNAVGIGGKTISDVKIYDEKSDLMTLDGQFVSTTDKSFNLIKNKLEQLFPNKTKYEL